MKPEIIDENFINELENEIRLTLYPVRWGKDLREVLIRFENPISDSEWIITYNEAVKLRDALQKFLK